MHVVEVQLEIVVLHWDGKRISHCGPGLGVEGFQALPVIVVGEAHIINIIVEIWVLLNALVKSLERVVQVRLLYDAVSDRIESHVDTVVDLVIVVLHLVIIDAVLFESSVQSLVNSVHVHSPHVINSLVDVAIVEIFAGYSWGKEPEKYILGFQLKHGYKYFGLIPLLYLRERMVRRVNSLRTKAAPVVIPPTLRAVFLMSSTSFYALFAKSLSRYFSYKIDSFLSISEAYIFLSSIIFIIITNKQ